MKSKYAKIDKVLMEARYYAAFADGEQGIIDLLDYWLEQWLQYKNYCPVCGTENICP